VTWNRDDTTEAYLDALTGVQALAHDLRDDEWGLPTDLPAWSVFDTIAHVSAVEDEMAGRAVPSSISDWSRFPHVDGPFQQYTEVGVEHRRTWTPDQLVAELDALVVERSQQLEMLPADASADMRGPAGLKLTAERVTSMRTFDIWAHEHDVRRATGRPDRMAGPAARVSRDRMLSAMPIILAREAAAPADTVVRWVVGEPQPRTITVAVTVEQRGEIVADDSRTPDAVITCDLRSLTLLACGRRSPTEVDLAVDGDRALAERVISAMAITP
jgi:uncharacterized protein (TIGR03083 family)